MSHKHRHKNRQIFQPQAPKTTFAKNQLWLQHNSIEERLKAIEKTEKDHYRELGRIAYPSFRFLLWWTFGGFYIYNWTWIMKWRKFAKKQAEEQQKLVEEQERMRKEAIQKQQEKGLYNAIVCKFCQKPGDRVLGGLRKLRDPGTEEEFYTHESCVHLDIAKKADEKVNKEEVAVVQK